MVPSADSCQVKPPLEILPLTIGLLHDLIDSGYQIAEGESSCETTLAGLTSSHVLRADCSPIGPVQCHGWSGSALIRRELLVMR
jgi:hypothetical protein